MRFPTQKGRHILALVLAAAGVFAAAAPAAEKLLPIPSPAKFAPPAGKIAFQDGDTIVFLGDSITSQCLSTQYIEDFFYTRFPKTRLHFHNAGTVGDRAADALQRFDADVAAFKPKYVSVLFGMNDGGFTDWQEPIFEEFQKNMTALLDKIGETGATPIPMTPTMFDAMPNRLSNRMQEPRDGAYNNVLKTYSAWVKEESKRRGLAVADLYAPMNATTEDRRRNEADWTMIPDTMHPTPAGHVVMAAAFLNDVAFCPPVSEILISKKNNVWQATVGNGDLTDLQGDDKVAFTFTAQSLPWVLPPDADEGRKLLPVAFKKPPALGNEMLAVRGLAPGKYELKIDGEPVGQWTNTELAVGIDLGENPKTPQYQQALKVALLNKARTARTEHPMRLDWATLKAQRNALKAVEEANDNPNRIAQMRKSFATFLEANQKSISEYVAKSQEIEEAIYAMNAPVARRYEIVPVAQSASGQQ